MRIWLISLFKPVLYYSLKKMLTGIKPLFEGENYTLVSKLRANGFHPAICTHPSIIFGEKKIIKTRSLFLELKIVYLKKCIRIGMLKGEKGHDALRELGIQPYYGNGKDFWFVEPNSPIVPYIIPDFPKPKGRIAVFSAITGDYDDVHEVLFKEDGIDYLLFTNNPSLKSKTWRVIQVKSNLNDVLLSREIKMMPHKYLGNKYEASIYIDANAVIYGEITELTRYLTEGKSFAVSRHGERGTVKKESQAIIDLIGLDKDVVITQYNQYIDEGFSDNSGLAECNILVRKHNEEPVIDLMNLWWDEFCRGIKRDQISLMPCIEKSGFAGLAWMEGGYSRHNQFCKIVSHK